MKTKLLLFTLLITTLSFSQTPIDEVLHYPFTGGSLVNEANPSTGDLTQTGSAATFVTDYYGTSGNAVTLNGDQFTGGTVSSTDLTLSFWLKPSTITSTERIIQMYEGSNGFRLELGAGNVLTWTGGLYNSSGAYSDGTKSATVNNLFDGNWHHIVLKGTSHTVQDWRRIDVYIDGVINNSLTAAIAFQSNNVTGFIGNGTLVVSPSSVSNYKESIDDIKVFDRALSDTEITALYNLCENCYAIDTSLVGDGTVTVNTTSSTSYGTYTSGTTVTLEATPNTGSIFNGWTGDISGSTNTISVVMDDNKTVTANFITSSLTHAYVDKNAGGGNDGSTWADAFVSLHDALVSGATTIWVAKGTYKPDVTDRNISFNVVTNIYGGFAGTETTLADRDITLIHTTNETILSGDLNGNDTAVGFSDTTRSDNSYHVVEVTQEDLVIDGFTIQDGHADATSGDDRFGAGIFKASSIANLTVKNSIIKNNVALSGAGVSYTTLAASSSAIIDACIFENNLANVGAGLDFHQGTGNGSVMNVTITNSLFNNNKTDDDVVNSREGFGAAAIRLRAFWSMYLNADLVNNTFVNNTNLGSSSSEFPTVEISKNSGFLEDFIIANNIFWGNTKTGGTISPAIGKTVSTYTRLTVGGNRIVTNNIDEDNFSLISGTTNTSTINPDLDTDFKLTVGSSAIDTGDNSYVATTTDLSGSTRILDTTVDMGAYEFDSNTASIVDDVFNNAISTYPNPVTDKLTISLATGETLQKVEVFNLLGKKVVTTTNTTVDFSTISAGIYILKVANTEGKIATRKIIKK